MSSHQRGRQNKWEIYQFNLSLNSSAELGGTNRQTSICICNNMDQTSANQGNVPGPCSCCSVSITCSWERCGSLCKHSGSAQPGESNARRQSWGALFLVVLFYCTFGVLYVNEGGVIYNIVQGSVGSPAPLDWPLVGGWVVLGS